MLRRVGSFLALILVATLVLAACGEPGDKVEPTVTRIPVENVPVPPTVVPTSDAASQVSDGTASGSGEGTTPSDTGAQTTFDIVMLDILFDVTELTVPANTEITINLVNNGALTHNFNIDELGVQSGDYAAGQTGTITFNSGSAAEYEYFCSIPGHRESGMVGKITVVDAAAQAESTPAGAATEESGPDAGAAASGPVTIDLAMLDISFDQTEITVPANTEITINLVNSGALTHSFDIDELNVHSGDYAAGQSGTVTFNSGAPGEYEFYCAIPGHREVGMAGKLIVTEGGAVAPPADAGAATPPSPASTVASPVASPVALQTTFDVVMEDIKFDVTELRVPANTDITINLVNKGALSHNFSIPDLNVNSGDYVGGQTGTIAFNSGAAGEHQFICDIPGHKDIGMVGKLIVVDQAAGDGAPADGSSGATTGQTTFEIQMLDIQFDISEITAPANTDITINLVNKGALSHNFSIPDLGVVSGDYVGGQTGTITFNSGAPGAYEYDCNIPGHRGIGMVGKIIVQ